MKIIFKDKIQKQNKHCSPISLDCEEGQNRQLLVIFFYLGRKTKENSRKEYSPKIFSAQIETTIYKLRVGISTVRKGVHLHKLQCACKEGWPSPHTDHCSHSTSTSPQNREVCIILCYFHTIGWNNFCAAKFFFSDALRCKLIVHVAFCYRLLDKKMLW